MVDAQDKVLGKLATQIAVRLRGKHKPEYTPHVDTGDYHRRRQRGQGARDRQKDRAQDLLPSLGLSRRHLSRRISPRCTRSRPERVLQNAVKGMLPKGPLGYAMLRKLKVYAGGTHPHSAQQPKALEIWS